MTKEEIREYKKPKAYKVDERRLWIPAKYKNKFNIEVDVAFLKYGVLIYPHNDLNNNKDNILHLTLTSKGQLKIGRRIFYKYWDYIPEKVRYIEYKKGLLMIPTEEKVDD